MAAGYNDPRFTKGPVKGPDVRWRGHQGPPDPEPQNGAIRVFHRGRWMTWGAWRLTPILLEDNNRTVIPGDGCRTLSPRTETHVNTHQMGLFDLQ
jgi:hypothetical protein